MTTATPITELDHEPTDPAARVHTPHEADPDRAPVEWARDTRTGQWRPLGQAGGYGWAALRMLFPDSTVNVPALSTGGVIPGRRTDPSTSTPKGPVIVRANTQRHRLLAAFGRAADGLYPSLGDALTDEEAAHRAAEVSMSSEYAKRCSELREAGLIAPTGDTREGAAGAARIVSRITERGAMVLTRLSS